MKKAIFLALSILLTAFTFAGCSSKPAASSDPAAKSDEPVELSFLTWGNQAHLDLYQKLIDKFTQTHPNIKVKLESVPFPDYQQKVTVLAAGQELPDIGWVSERMVPQFMANGILEDVTDLNSDANFKMDDFIPSTLALFQKDEKLYGIPFSTPPSVMFYNKDLIEKAGLKSPNDLAKEGKWTWEEFEKTAKAITSGTGASKIYGANFFRDWKTWILLSSYSWSNGSGPFNKEMTQFTWNDQYGTETLSMLQRMMFTDGSHPKAGEQVSFESGKIGMFFDVYSYVSKARTIKDFKWDIAPMPSGSQGSAPMLGQAGYSIFKGTKHLQETKEFLKFIASEEGVQATSAYFVPPRTSVLNSDLFLKQPDNPDPAHIKQAVIDEMPKAHFQPGHVEWQKIDNTILAGFDQLFGQTAQPQDIMKSLEEKINPILKK
ncbi:ABC transporter substrate-binding protein [Brevibacillus centrosporus]|uniref:Carbohydrate ABC transporter substrate-binding protein, CUT1 family n=1 Tax=Brevibacillus centrosporus TaxID=54910 RepID=A0A1I3M6J1_9BACL|nr:sugar ABC transporter substrate-binding protein [Brevibacillus centrosporus]MEC2131253.1 sugar ABC transporter substrate-binding protein [Brevibacillus centrosporus]MED1951312.1 sugar ABC transporter substrate-binding protein [Brevibacillus centrosporus]RNB72710.1 sugar ABC transporter substrate-binding protein [Brevibacillus centrosporus]SFI92669.1 carbohydrate ABC transporter substrate-binding protein, CUT1 family [Brevibacillus centrosporus]GED33681.1 ABC transporter substrate-binding pr